MKRSTLLATGLSITFSLVISHAYAKKSGNPAGSGAPFDIVAFEPFGSATPRTWINDVSESGGAAVGGVEWPSGETQSAFLNTSTHEYTLFDIGTELTAVNNHDQLVGRVGTAAAFWPDAGAVPITLPPLAGDNRTLAFAVNDAGMVLGVSQFGQNNPTPVVWRVFADDISSFVTQGPYALPSAELDGHKLGLSESIDGVSKASGHSQVGASIWTLEIDELNQLVLPAQPTTLGAFDDPSSASGLGISNAGDVVGYSDGLPFLAPLSEAMALLPMLRKAIVGEAADINDAGKIVGRLGFAGKPNATVPGEYAAVLWDDGEPVLLSNLINTTSGWESLAGATDITSNGVIAGGGRLDNLQDRGFLMFPRLAALSSTTTVPEPTAAVLCGLGLWVLLAAKKRQSLFRLARRTAPLMCVPALAITSSLAADFLPLGDLPGGEFNSQAWSVSADGSMVVGRSFTDGGIEAFVWTEAQGMQTLGALPIGATVSEAYGITNDGQLVVGRLGSTAIRWTNELGWVDVGGAHQSAYGVSAAGEVIVGGPEPGRVGEAWSWTEAGGLVPLGDLQEGLNDSAAWGASADGSVIVGYGSSAAGVEAFRWTESGGMVGLGDLPGGDFGSSAIDVSADGSVVVGYGTNSSGIEAMRWTEQSGMLGLGGNDSYARAISGDGKTIVGVNQAASGNEAFIWDANEGMRSLQQVLMNEGVDLTGWSLEWALDVSDDGSAIVGWGFNPSGQREAFLARITAVPEPGTVVLLTLFAMATTLRNCMAKH